MEQLTKNQAVATSQEAVQNQNEPQLRDENAHNDKSVHGDRKSGSAGMPRPISYAVFCLKKKTRRRRRLPVDRRARGGTPLLPRVDGMVRHPLFGWPTRRILRRGLHRP